MSIGWLERSLHNTFPLLQIETFSLQVVQTKLQISLCGMRLMDFPLVLGIIDAILTYLVIMIQFDHK